MRERYFRNSYDNNICGDGMPTNYFDVVPAGTYYIPVRYRKPEAYGPYTIHVTGTALPPPPANDDCANAQAIGNVTDLTFNTTTASNDGPGECITSPNIWYLYTAPSTGQAIASLCNSAFDTKLAVYGGPDCGTSPIIGCNDDTLSNDCGWTSIVVFDAVQGHQYLVEVGGSGPTFGEGLLSVQTISQGCLYVIGDANNSSTFTGLDVTYSVRFFKGGPHPPYSCECTPGNTWYVSGDVNGSCSFTGLDITYMVRYFKGGPAAIPCPDCPPAGFLAPHPTPEP
jgi:hypothetical protein